MTNQQWNPRHIPKQNQNGNVRHKKIQTKQDNLTRKERITIRELILNPWIVINKADKGSTIVVEIENISEIQWYTSMTPPYTNPSTFSLH